MNVIECDLKVIKSNMNESRDSKNYKILETIGEGTYGTVFKCKYKNEKEFVAIKKFNDNEFAQEEIDILKQLKHKNIITYLGHYIKSDTYYMVLEFMNKDLRKYISSLVFFGFGNLSPDLIQSYLYQLLLGTEYIHEKGFMHRDLKPGNLLIDAEGHLKICDFGSCIEYKPCMHYLEYSTSRWYRSPELCKDVSNQTPSLDMWSIGCIFVQMFTKKDLFKGLDDGGQLDSIYDNRGHPGETPKPICANKSGEDLCTKGVDLLDKLLDYDPITRITAKDAVKHSYFDDLDKTLYY